MVLRYVDHCDQCVLCLRELQLSLLFMQKCPQRLPQHDGKKVVFFSRCGFFCEMKYTFESFYNYPYFLLRVLKFELM